MMQHVDDCSCLYCTLKHKKCANSDKKKIKQSIGDVFDDIFDSIFIEATQRQETANNFGKIFKNICERIHFGNAAGVQPRIFLKMDCLTYILKIVPIFTHFVEQIDDFRVSRFMVKTSQ